MVLMSFMDNPIILKLILKNDGGFVKVLLHTRVSKLTYNTIGTLKIGCNVSGVENNDQNPNDPAKYLLTSYLW